LVTEHSAGTSTDDEIALLQSATTTQKAPIPLENKIEPWLADILGCRWGGPFEAAVDGYKRGVDEQGMDRGLVPSHPKYVRGGKVPEAGKFTERTSQEKRDLLPLLQEGVQETSPFRQTSLPDWAVEGVASIPCLAGNNLVRDRLAPFLIERNSARPQKFLEVDAVQNAQRDDLLDMPWRTR
jgi:hypothetical protein